MASLSLRHAQGFADAFAQVQLVLAENVPLLASGSHAAMPMTVSYGFHVSTPLGIDEFLKSLRPKRGWIPCQPF